jgi:hypothetical protein
MHLLQTQAPKRLSIQITSWKQADQQVSERFHKLCRTNRVTSMQMLEHLVELCEGFCDEKSATGTAR